MNRALDVMSIIDDDVGRRTLEDGHGCRPGIRRLLPLLMVMVMLVFLGIVFFLNHCTLFYDDDYGYGAMARGGWDNFWHSFSLCPHRPVPHLLLRIFCGLLGETAFDVLNTLVWIPLFALVLRLASRRWIPSVGKVILSVTCAFFLVFSGDACLWSAGSCNYLWMSVVALSFMLVRRMADGRESSFPKMVLFAAIAMLAGWCQEGISLPLAFACVVDLLVFRRCRLGSREIVLAIAFAMGMALLLWEAIGYIGGSLRPEPLLFDLELLGCVKRILQIAVSCRAVWVVAVLWLLSRDRLSFWRRNSFELSVSAGTVGLIMVVGYYGGRSLWAANLSSLVVIVREFNPGLRLCCLGMSAVAALGGCLVSPALRIREHASDFLTSYLAASPSVTTPVVVHEHSDTWPLTMWLFQPIYLWDTGANPNTVIGWYFRRHAPLVLQSPMYRDLYLRDAICVPENRLQIDGGDFYTREDINAVVVPFADGSVPEVALVEADKPNDVVDRFVRMLIRRRGPFTVGNPRAVRLLETDHGRYLLVAKSACDSDRIRRVIFQ